MTQAANAGATAGLDAAIVDVAALIATNARLSADNDRLVAEAKAKQLLDQHGNAANESRASSKERFAIIIDEGRTEHDIDPVPVSPNGRMYQIKRGQVVEVPFEVIDVLNHAVEDRAVPKTDAQGQPAGFDVRKARRFPFQNYGKTVDANGDRTGLKLPEMEAAVA
jgi:hypothetical protein